MPRHKATKWSVQPISREHDCSAFDCGKQPLNDFLQKYALMNRSLGIAQTFVATMPGSLIVDGYYCVSAGAVAFKNLPATLAKRLPRYPIPVGHIGKLAVTLARQRRGLGEMLLFDAFERIVKASDFVGIHAVEVWAKDDDAKEFYLKYGFNEVLDDRLHLYVSMKTLKKLGLV